MIILTVIEYTSDTFIYGDYCFFCSNLLFFGWIGILKIEIHVSGTICIRRCNACLFGFPWKCIGFHYESPMFSERDSRHRWTIAKKWDTHFWEPKVVFQNVMGLPWIGAAFSGNPWNSLNLPYDLQCSEHYFDIDKS